MPGKADPELDKKEGVILETENVLDTTLEEEEQADLDEAARFLELHKDLDTSHIDISKLRHKIDRNVVSLLCLCFIMQFLDKAVYNVSHGFHQRLNLTN
jgi:hypothetical protein